MTTWRVIQADVTEWAENYDGPPFDAVLCDPPYGLGQQPDMAEVLKHWLDGDDCEQRGGGFMGKSWDSFVPGPAAWRALLSVCKPGAPLLAFGGTRTADLLGVACRLGGWERFDEIDCLSWIFASGFPKSTALGKAIDKAAGMERGIIGVGPYASRRPRQDKAAQGLTYNDDNYVRPAGDAITAPATPQAIAFHEYGTALKPAHEPVLLFRKPLAQVSSDDLHAATGWDWWHHEKAIRNTPAERLKVLKRYGLRLPSGYVEVDLFRVSRKALHPGVESDTLFVAKARRQWRGGQTEPETLGRVDVRPYRRWKSRTYAANALVWGTGGLWVDGCRVVTGDEFGGGAKMSSSGHTLGNFEHYEHDGFKVATRGRFPPNLLLCHSPGCVKVGTRRVRAHWSQPTRGTMKTGQVYGQYGDKYIGKQVGYADPDGTESQDEWLCEPGCAVEALGRMSGESKSKRPDMTIHHQKAPGCNGIYNEYTLIENARYPDKGTATRFYPNFSWHHELAERLAEVTPFRYCAKSARAERDAGLDGFTLQQGFDKNTSAVIRRSNPDTGIVREFEYKPSQRHNPHPTVKPISLCKWLASLCLPPPAYAPRRILVAFGGTGSEAIGAMLAGWDDITLVETEAEYCDLADARLAWWQQRMEQSGLDEPGVLLKWKPELKIPAQMEMSIG